MQVFNDVLEQLRKDLQKLENKPQDKLWMLRCSIKISRDALTKLKRLKQEDGLKNTSDQIEFYRNIKPRVLSRVIYFAISYNMELGLPMVSHKHQIKYLKKYLKRFQQFIDEYIDFYKYIKTENINHDEQFFTENYIDLKLFPEMGYFYTDPHFNTSHDTILANMLAYEGLIADIKSTIIKLKQKAGYLSDISSQIKLEWSANNIDLVELIYALHCSGAVGAGKINIKQLANALELLFNIKLGNYSRAFLELSSRSSSPTKFLDHLKYSLEMSISQ